jgi:Helix-hairpin-helix motif
MIALLPGGRLLVVCGMVILASLFVITPVAAESSSSRGELVLWLLGLRMANDHGTQKVDINSATVEQLRAVPGIERRQALRIVASRPYAKVEDLARAGLSPLTIERLSRVLVVDPQWPSAFSARAPASR